MTVPIWVEQRNGKYTATVTHDMRSAAICIVHGATLATRNARDYAQLPGLTFDVWN